MLLDSIVPIIIEKGWGREIIVANNEMYCGKLLVFNEGSAKFSMHYHMIKDETWYVLDGEFALRYIDTDNADVKGIEIKRGDVVHIKPGQPHRLESGKNGGTIMEVSTQHFDSDSYRVKKGDSQK